MHCVRGVIVGAPSCLYFYKGNCGAFESYDIYFLVADMDIGIHDGISVGGKILSCYLFAPFAGDIMLCHWNPVLL